MHNQVLNSLIIGSEHYIRTCIHLYRNNVASSRAILCVLYTFICGLHGELQGNILDLIYIHIKAIWRVPEPTWRAPAPYFGTFVHSYTATWRAPGPHWQAPGPTWRAPGQYFESYTHSYRNNLASFIAICLVLYTII